MQGAQQQLDGLQSHARDAWMYPTLQMYSARGMSSNGFGALEAHCAPAPLAGRSAAFQGAWLVCAIRSCYPECMGLSAFAAHAHVALHLILHQVSGPACSCSPQDEHRLSHSTAGAPLQRAGNIFSREKWAALC